MMRQWWPGVALILAACAASGSAPPPPGTAQAFFTGPDTIQVTASDYVLARAVALVGPFGEVAAVSIDTTRNSGYAAPSGGSLGSGGGAEPHGNPAENASLLRRLYHVKPIHGRPTGPSWPGFRYSSG